MTGAPASLARGQIPCAEVLGLFEDPAALFDESAVLRAANDAFARIFSQIPGFTRPGTGWSLFLGEAERHGILPGQVCHALRLIEERLIDRHDAQPHIEARLSNGQTWRIRLTQTSDGGFAMILHATADREGKAESEREVEQLMAKVLEACPTSLIMARVGDGQILYRSPSATELLGKGRDSRDHFALREERADFVTQLLPDARVDDMRITGRRPDGSEFPASISARLIDYRGEDVVVSSTTDLSGEIALQEELVRQKEQIFRAEKMSALGELLAGVAHELNNPLSIVVGNALLLHEETLAPSVRLRVEKLSDAAERCVRIVRTFLSMARDRPLDIAAVPLADVVEAAVDAFRASEDGGAAEVHVALGDGLAEVLVDEVQIVQVLTNLLINAGQAMAESGMGGTVTLSTAPRPPRGMIRLRVVDDGPGVPPDIAGRIFDPLFTTKSAGKGTGVGLALCHRIMAAHGGAIQFEPGQAGGACFALDLPFAGPGRHPA